MCFLCVVGVACLMQLRVWLCCMSDAAWWPHIRAQLGFSSACCFNSQYVAWILAASVLLSDHSFVKRRIRIFTTFPQRADCLWLLVNLIRCVLLALLRSRLSRTHLDQQVSGCEKNAIQTKRLTTWVISISDYKVHFSVRVTKFFFLVRQHSQLNLFES